MKRYAAGWAGLAMTAALMTTAAVAAPVTFPDIGNHWAAPFIARMAERGVVSGMEDGRYAPDDEVTGAQFAVMVTKEFYPEDIQGKGDQWYVPFMNAASDNQLLKGVTGAPDSPLTRYEMASVMHQVMVNAGKAQTVEDTSGIGDWAQVPADYQAAVAGCYQAGLLSGVNEKGDFAGKDTMDRAQAAVVMDKLIQTLKGEEQKPEQKQEKITGSNTELVGDNSSYADGKFHLKASDGSYGGAAIKFDRNGAELACFTVSTTRAATVSLYNNNMGRGGKLIFKAEMGANETRDFQVTMLNGINMSLYVDSGDMTDAVISNFVLK